MQIICLVLSIIQIAFAISRVVNKPIMTSMETQNLKTLNRPIKITVCKTNQFSIHRFHSMGYGRLIEFFSGNVSSGGVLSWTGALGNMTFIETLHYLYQGNVANIEFETPNGPIATKFLPFNGFCKIYETLPRKYVQIEFQNCKESDTYIVSIYDDAAANSFQLASMTGGRIMLDSCKTRKFVDYNVKLAETRDTSGGDKCVEYPSKYFDSYAACIDAEIIGKTEPVFGYGLPFFTNSSGKPIRRLPSHQNTIEWLENIVFMSFGGVLYQPENCLPPCTKLTAYAELQRSPVTDFNFTLYLYFDERFEVKTTMIAYGPESLLVEIGSCLGLWLGLSVIGFFEIAIKAFERGTHGLRHTRMEVINRHEN